MQYPLSPRQLEFVLDSTKKINIAHGSVRSGKTVGTLFRFMQAVNSCPDSQIWMIGHSQETIYHNAVRLLLEANQPNNPLSIYNPFLTWHPGKRQLKFKDKTISTLGAKDEGAIGSIQGKTFSLCYCDEITLYPESIIDMIDTRLSNAHSMLFCSCNPSHPTHKIKQWIDKSDEKDSQYYSLQFTLDHNPYVDEGYKQRIKYSLSGLFYKRNYLGMWCLAEGAIFDFFDHKIHVVKKPPRSAEYWIAGIDYGISNNFSCVLIGINTGHFTQSGVCRWVEKEYVWNSHKKGRQKTNAELARDVEEFLAPYSLRGIYIDPSAAAFKVELRKKGMQIIDADNDVLNGITYMTSEMAEGNLFVCEGCDVLIDEIQQYSWDRKKAEKGEDAPLKQNDHCFEAGTLVDTINGQIPIEKINKGDLVLTSAGFRPVLETWKNEKETYNYKLLGINFNCTDSHKFYTLNRGFVKISEIKNEDIFVINLCTTQLSKKLFGEERYTNDIQNLKDIMTNIISVGGDEKLVADISIETFTNSIMEKFHQDTIFITKTKIPQTTTLAIWNWCIQKNISKFIQKILHQRENGLLKILHSFDQKQQDGIEVPKEENGIENMPNNFGKIESQLQKNANVAEENIKLKITNKSFVQIIVNQNEEEICTLMMSLNAAYSVIKNLNTTNIQKENFVHEVVPLKTLGKNKVYNLTVQDKHEFYANNILVSNCLDALRYATFTHKVTPYQPYKHNPNDYMKNRFQSRF